MRIAHVVCTYPPYRGGMGNVTKEYVERLRLRGHDAFVITPAYAPVANDPEYIQRLLPIMKFGNAAVLRHLYNQIKGSDIVHLHYPFFGSAFLTAHVAKKQRIPLVMTYHMDPIASGLRGKIFKVYQRYFLPVIARKSDKLLVSSVDYAESSDLAQFPDQLKRVEDHSFGVDIERFYPGKEFVPRRQLKIEEHVPVILFVGGLDQAHYFKGLDILIKALSGLQNKEWVLVVVGEGDLKENYKKQVQVAGIEKKVRFMGNVSEIDLPRIYRMADIHAFPSTEKAEAFGLVALEAAASGTPSVASDLPGVRKVVLDGVTGQLVPAKNVFALRKALHNLIDNGLLRNQLGTAARIRVEQEFSWQTAIDRLEQVYQELMD